MSSVEKTWAGLAKEGYRVRRDHTTIPGVDWWWTLRTPRNHPIILPINKTEDEEQAREWAQEEAVLIVNEIRKGGR